MQSGVYSLRLERQSGISENERKQAGILGTLQEKEIWDFFTKKGLNAYAVAGLMGNLFAESGLNPCNLQNTYNNKLGMGDEEYTKAVDAGSIR